LADLGRIHIPEGRGHTDTVVNDGETSVKTFLIADIRGYSRYTEDYGDEASARLAGKFVELVEEDVEAHGGMLIEVRGDEALAVFTSARQAIRAAVDLQARFVEETEADPSLPLKVGIGIDSGEAVQLADGSYRGAALNVAARLCGRAHGGEVIVSEATSRLAGRLGGIQYSDRGRVHLKNIPEPLHILQVYSEHDAPPPSNRWVLMIFGKPGRTLGWKLGLGVILVAAATAVGVVYLTTGDGAEPGSASPATTGASSVVPSGSGVEATLAPNADLDAIVPAAIWKDCKLQTVPEPTAIQTAVCLPGQGIPDRWEISSYRNGADLTSAYRAELSRHERIRRGTGRCNAFIWGGELQWLHGRGKPGGRAFCYFDGNDAVIVWSHERLGQPTHRDVLVTAREGGSDHVGLTRWWRPWHHLIGKAQ
jgi:class 3 adenylate cyclase